MEGMNITHSLVGRFAKCEMCDKERASNYDLSFFEYRGAGSKRALEICKTCGYYDIAHIPSIRKKGACRICLGFEPHGAYEFDSYYCGCRGWD